MYFCVCVCLRAPCENVIIEQLLVEMSVQRSPVAGAPLTLSVVAVVVPILTPSSPDTAKPVLQLLLMHAAHAVWAVVLCAV